MIYISYIHPIICISLYIYIYCSTPWTVARRPACPPLSPRNLLKFMSFKSRDTRVKSIVYLTHAALVYIPQESNRYQPDTRMRLFQGSSFIVFLHTLSSGGKRLGWKKKMAEAVTDAAPAPIVPDWGHTGD